MRIAWLAWILLLATTRVVAMQFPVEIIEQFDNARVVAFIPDRDLESAPAWDPLSGPPPLTVAQAIAAVKAHQSRETQEEPFSVEELELRRIPSQDGHWHYLVKARQGNRLRYYVVLMNGKVIPSVQEPEAVK